MCSYIDEGAVHQTVVGKTIKILANLLQFITQLLGVQVSQLG